MPARRWTRIRPVLSAGGGASGLGSKVLPLGTVCGIDSPEGCPWTRGGPPAMTAPGAPSGTQNPTTVTATADTKTSERCRTDTARLRQMLEELRPVAICRMPLPFRYGVNGRAPRPIEGAVLRRIPIPVKRRSRCAVSSSRRTIRRWNRSSNSRETSLGSFGSSTRMATRPPWSVAASATWSAGSCPVTGTWRPRPTRRSSRRSSPIRPGPTRSAR